MDVADSQTVDLASYWTVYIMYAFAVYLLLQIVLWVVSGEAETAEESKGWWIREMDRRLTASLVSHQYDDETVRHDDETQPGADFWLEGQASDELRLVATSSTYHDNKKR